MNKQISIEKLLESDFRKSNRKEKLIDYVENLPWFKKNNLKANSDNVEKMYWMLKKKYPFMIAYIQPSSIMSWVVMVKTTDTHQWINTIYVLTFFEMYLKVIIIANAYFNQGKMQHDQKGRPNEEKKE